MVLHKKLHGLLKKTSLFIFITEPILIKCIKSELIVER